MWLQIDSPYLRDPKRLADILAAIQVMGSHTWDMRPLEHWLLPLGGRPQSVPEAKGSWEVVFREHPEFFGEEESKDRQVRWFYLRWRRAYERTYDPVTLRAFEPAEIQKLKDENLYDTQKISRRPLTSDEIGTLMNTAIELQSQVIAADNRRRWWLPVLIAGIGLLGVLVTSLFRSAVGGR